MERQQKATVAVATVMSSHSSKGPSLDAGRNEVEVNRGTAGVVVDEWRWCGGW